MKLRYYLRGLGIGIIVTAVIMGVALDGKRELTDDEIRARAAELGMIENTVLAPAPTKEGDADSQGQEEGAASDAEQPEEMPTTAPAPTVTAALTPTAVPTVTAALTPTAVPTVTAAPTPTAKPTPTATAVPTVTAAPTPTAKPTQTAVPTPTAKPTPTAAPTPTAKPTPTAVPTPTAKPTPTAAPTSTVAPTPTTAPTTAPTPTPDSGADNAQTVTITINGGEGSGTVSRKVAQAGLVESAADFDNYLCANGYDKHLAVGSHVIPVGATYEEIADILVSRPR